MMMKNLYNIFFKFKSITMKNLYHKVVYNIFYRFNPGGNVMLSSVTVLVGILLVGTIFGIISWEHSDAVMQDPHQFVDPADVSSLKLRKTVFWVSTIAMLATLMLAYNYYVGMNVGLSPAAALPPPEQLVQLAQSVNDPLTCEMALKLRLDPETLKVYLDEVARILHMNDTYTLSQYCDLIFKNVNYHDPNHPISGFSIEQKAGMVRAIGLVYTRVGYFDRHLVPDGLKFMDFTRDYYTTRQHVSCVLADILGWYLANQ